MSLMRAWTAAPRYSRLRRATHTAKPRSQWFNARSTSPILGLAPAIAPLDDVVVANGPALSIVLAAVFGLPLALWTYKCAIMVVFQRKIIYMGYIPPGSRTEELSQNDPDLVGLTFEKVEIASDPGIVLRGYVFRKDTPSSSAGVSPRKAIIVYFQGNVGSPLNRLPLFRKLLLHPLLQRSTPQSPPIDLEIIAIPPRSYGRSTNSSPSEERLLMDYTAVCEYATARAEQGATGLRDSRVPLIFMGHSLGASIAAVLLSRFPARLASSDSSTTSPVTEGIASQSRVRCDGLIFENGFASIPRMVKALYPHHWLPYHHLGSFAFDRWDALACFENQAESATPIPVPEGTTSNTATQPPPSLLHTIPILFISSEKDEMVPPTMMQQLYDAVTTTRSLVRPGEGAQVRWLAVKDALHDFAWQKEVWGKGIVDFLKHVAVSARKGY